MPERKKTGFNTIPRMFFRTVDRLKDRPALHDKVNGRWRALSFEELADQVKWFASGLAVLGVKPRDKVAILSTNSSKWAICDYAIACLGAVSVPVYPTLQPVQTRFILIHSNTKYIITENREQTDKILGFKDSCHELIEIISMEDSSGGHDDILSFTSVLKRGKLSISQTGFDLRERAMSVKPDDLLSLVYTSGTTGDPKGVMLTHRNMVSNVISGLEAIHADPTDRFLSFLPLSHCFERMVGHYAPFSAGCSLYYAEGIEKIAENMREVKPTIMTTVPRLFEKMHTKVLENVENGPALKRRMFGWAMKTGRRYVDYLDRAERPPGLLRFKYGLADKLVFSKLKRRVGGSLRFFISGAAPLPEDIGRFFAAANIPILEGYGLTETSPVISVNREELARFGTVGLPLNGVSTKIADDGEIICCGDNVMKGYYRDPEATGEVIDGDGWFHTGDIGVFDDKGYLKIVDRKKDLIITSYGKNIAPAPLECALKSSRLVEQALVVGNNRKFVSALVVPAFPALEEWARSENISAKDRPALLEYPGIIRLYGEIRERANEGFSNFEKIKKLRLIPEEWSIANGILTPTLKVKRRMVEKRYAGLIEEMYSEK